MFSRMGLLAGSRQVMACVSSLLNMAWIVELTRRLATWTLIFCRASSQLSRCNPTSGDAGRGQT